MKDTEHQARWLLAIPDAIRQLDKLDRELLTRRDLEHLFGVSKVRAGALMTAFGAGRTGHIRTLPRAELLRQLRRHRRRAAFCGEEARRERRATSPPVPAAAVLVGWFDGGGRQPWRATRPSASRRSHAAASAGGEAQNGGSAARPPAYRAAHEGRGGRRAIGALVNAGHWERVHERALWQPPQRLSEDEQLAVVLNELADPDHPHHRARGASPTCWGTSASPRRGDPRAAADARRLGTLDAAGTPRSAALDRAAVPAGSGAGPLVDQRSAPAARVPVAGGRALPARSAGGDVGGSPRRPAERTRPEPQAARVAEHAQLQREAQLVAGPPPGPDVLRVVVAQGVVAHQVRLALRKVNQGRPLPAGSERFSEPSLFRWTYAEHRIRNGLAQRGDGRRKSSHQQPVDPRGRPRGWSSRRGRGLAAARAARWPKRPASGARRSPSGAGPRKKASATIAPSSRLRVVDQYFLGHAAEVTERALQAATPRRLPLVPKRRHVAAPRIAQRRHE